MIIRIPQMIKTMVIMPMLQLIRIVISRIKNYDKNDKKNSYPRYKI